MNIMQLTLVLSLCMVVVAWGASDSETLNIEGNDLGRQGNFKDAITKYDQAIRTDPTYHEPWYNRGKAKLNIGDLNGAISDFDKALELYRDKSGKADVLNNRGIAKKKNHDLTGAIADYNAALRNNPKLYRVYLNRGIAYYELGEEGKAIVDFKIADNFGIQEAKSALRQLGIK